MNKSARIFIGLTALGISAAGGFLFAMNKDEAVTETSVTVETVANTSPPTIILPSGEIMVEEGGSEQIPTEVIDTPMEIARWIAQRTVDLEGVTAEGLCDEWQTVNTVFYDEMSDAFAMNGIPSVTPAELDAAMHLVCTGNVVF